MKKIVSVFLVALLLLTLAVPAFAAAGSHYRSTIPMIMISGDGDAIYKKEGDEEIPVLSYRRIMEGLNGGGESGEEGEEAEENGNSAVLDATKNILTPFLLEGVLRDKWDGYYDALYNEISDLFKDIMLDENGEVSNDTDISGYHRWVNGDSMWWGTDKKAADGTYGFEDYHFWYDWRLDPLKIADEFHQYVEAIKQKTGAPRVAVTTRCLGSSVILAYIAKYGTDNLYGVGLDGTTSNGSEVIGGALSGSFKIDGNSISRFLADCEAFDMFSVDSFVGSTLELLENSGVMDTMTAAARRLIYYKIEKGVISALARSTLFTMPCYWALVPAKDYEKAKEYVFGEEGSEMRQTYAGLIQKIDAYNETVKVKIPELLDGVVENETNLCIISKYGAQLVPIVKDADLIADQYSSVESSSFGATTARIGTTLSDEYIAERTAAGYGDYISPDKQIDASTCRFPDYTYFVKGVRHSDWTMVENDIMEQVLTADRQTTVRDFGYTQFIVAHTGTDDWEVMTEDNCHTENWSETSSTANKTLWDKLSSFFKTLINWLKILFKKTTASLKGE